MVLVSLLANTDSLALLPRIWATNPLFKGSLEAILVRENLPAPEIVQMHSLSFPLTPAAAHLSLLFQRAAGKPFGGKP